MRMKMLFTFLSTLILVVNSINPLQLNYNKNKNSYVNFNHEKYGVLINDLTKFVGNIFIWPQSFPQGFANNNYGKNPTNGSIFEFKSYRKTTVLYSSINYSSYNQYNRFSRRELVENSLMDSNSTNEFISDTEKFFTKSEYQSDLSLTSLLGKLFIGFVLYSLTIWTIIGNIIVCVIVVTNRQLKQGGMSNFLIGNLALSDLLLGLTVLPFSATLSTFKTWLFGKILCDLWLSIDVLCSTASIWALLVISLDRYIATNHPIRYRKQKNSIKMAIIYCTVSWLISIIISLGPLFFISSEESGINTPSNVINNDNISTASVTSFSSAHHLDPINFNGLMSTSAPKKSGLRKMENSSDYECVLFQTPSFVILSSLGSFYLPLILMIGLYTGVFLKIRQQSKIKFRKKKDNRKKEPSISETKPKETTENILTENFSNKKIINDHEDEILNSNTKNRNETMSLTSGEILTRKLSTDTVNTLSNHKIKSPKMPSKLSSNIEVKSKKSSSPAGRGVVRRISQLKRPVAGQISTSEARITKTLGIIMGVFVVCWLPFFIIYNIRSQLTDPDSISGNTMEFFLWLGYFNSALNPILYAILNANFRNAFRDILACRCCFSPNHNRNLSRLSSVNNNTTTTNNSIVVRNSKHTSNSKTIDNNKNIKVTLA